MKKKENLGRKLLNLGKRLLNAIILVGAQAIYLHVGDADLAVAPYTTDGDLALNPALLGQKPTLDEALTHAGFVPKTADSVGIWLAHRETPTNPNVAIAVDLLVPQSVSPGSGRRAAKLNGHSHRAARIVSGLEGAIIDNDPHMIASLKADCARQMSITVAGPAALLIAKVHKIHDRGSSPRVNDKDALDVFRLLRGIPTENIASRWQKIMTNTKPNSVAANGIKLLEEQFGTRTALGAQMIIRSLEGLMDADEIAKSCELLTTDLLFALKK